MKFLRPLLVIVAMIGVVHCILASEPVCSRFDYDERILAKTIRLEMIIEDLVKRVTETEISARESEALEKKITEIEARLNASLTKTTETEEKTEHLKKTTCPSAYRYDSDVNLCWKFEKGAKLNYFDAKDRCSKDGASLMILNAANITRFIQAFLAAAGAGTVFVGATDLMEDGIFRWSNGETAQQIDWKSGEPSRGKSENCLAMASSSNYQFYDKQCSAKYDLLCQIQLGY